MLTLLKLGIATDTRKYTFSLLPSFENKGYNMNSACRFIKVKDRKDKRWMDD